MNPRSAISSLPARRSPTPSGRIVDAGRRPAEYRPPELPTELRIINGMGGHPGHPSHRPRRRSLRAGGIVAGGRPPLGATAEDVPGRTASGGDLPGADVRRIAALVRDGGSAPSSSALAPIQPAGTHPPLFLCEGIGIYYPLIRHLGSEQPVYGTCHRDRAATTRGWRTWPPPISRRSGRCSRRGRISWAACRSGGSWRSRWPSSCARSARKSRCWPCSTRRLPGPPRRSRSPEAGRPSGQLASIRLRLRPRRSSDSGWSDLRRNLRRAEERASESAIADPRR